MSELENMNEKRGRRRKMNKRTILLFVTTRQVEACAYNYRSTNTKHMTLVHTQAATSSYYFARFLFIRVKKNQLDAQLILSIVRQPLHVSGVPRPIIRRYNRMYTAVGTYSF
jgi:hypothetical protein